MCTTMILTRGATADGSMMVTHSDDDELGDQRLIYVPAQDHAPDSRRQVCKENYPYPRMVTNERGPGYDTPDYPRTEPIGFIPQVAHTYSYFDGNYGIINEHNLMMGECTNKGKYEPPCVPAGTLGAHIRILYSAELSRIALERCKTAREAVTLMGDLIEEYGYYSEAETLLVVDGNEGWVFEMCALPDEEYHSAWVAQRVPDGEVFVAANEFRIREVKKDSPDDFLYSKLLFPGLEKLGWWNPSEPLDWLRAASPGEYGHPYYSLRRVWRVLDRVNPDLALSPWVQNAFTKDYPFSVKPKRKLEVRDVFALYRDHYEGTEFDLTQGVAAGPHGNPHRFTGPLDSMGAVSSESRHCGAWERSVSVFYQGYTYVGQIRPEVPEESKGVLWFGPDVSDTTCFTPFFTKAERLPQSYQTGSPQKFDRNVAWWVFDFVANWSRLNFQRMMRMDIEPRQAELELQFLVDLRTVDDQVRADPGKAIALITGFCEGVAERTLNQWWDLADTLVAKYTDGYINRTGGPPIGLGYPLPWLRHTDYEAGPTSYLMRR